MPSVGAPSDPRIKGAAVREALLWYERTRGSEAAKALLDDLPGPYCAYVDPSRPALGILASTWYPCAVTHHMLDRASAGMRDAGREFARDAVRGIAPQLITGIYRILFRAVASPELYARHVPRIWRQLHTTGDRTFSLVAPGEARSVVERWDGHHPMLCWITIYTMATVFESMRFSNVSVERLCCVGEGAPRCETILRFAK